MKTKNFEEKIEIPQGVEVKVDKGMVTVSQGNKVLTRNLNHKKILIEATKEDITFKYQNGTKREKTSCGTFKAHVKNMFKGITQGHTYKLKICSGHFPMSVTINNGKFVVNNFLGEKTPREIKLKEGAQVKLDGDLVTVEGIDKELVSQTAADIELLTRIKGRDLRIFQDGIYIINKDGKEIS